MQLHWFMISVLATLSACSLHVTALPSAQRLDYDTVACGDLGPRNLTETSGTFRSPVVVNTTFYPQNTLCEWIIQASEDTTKNRKIVLEFSVFNLETCNPCHNCDSVMVYDGPDTKSDLLASICGVDIPQPIMSTGPYLYVLFTTDQDAFQFRGFTAHYSSETGCGPSLPRVLKSPTGIITSPFFPTPYDNNMMCGWRIDAPEDKVVVLNWIVFHLEGNTKTQCPDWVEVFNGPTPGSESLGRRCGNFLPLPSITTTSSMYVQFSSGSFNTFPGFQAKYSFENKDTPPSVKTTHQETEQPVQESTTETTPLVTEHPAHSSTPYDFTIED